MADVIGCHDDSLKVLLLEEELRIYQHSQYRDALPWQLAVIEELLGSCDPADDVINYYCLMIKRASVQHHVGACPEDGDHTPIAVLKKTIQTMKDDVSGCDVRVKVCLYDLIALGYLKMALCHHEDIVRLERERE